EERDEERRLAASVWPDDHVDRSALDAQRHVRKEVLALARDRHVEKLDERRLAGLLGHASLTSARIIASTLACISRSNRSAVKGPDAMWLMMYTFTPASSCSTLSIGAGNDSSEKTTLIFSFCRSLTMSRSSAADGVKPCCG